MTQNPEYDGLNTDDIIIEALLEIAEKDSTTFEQIWEDGYTQIHSADEVEELIKKYIRENVKPEDVEDYYIWGCGEKIWMNREEA